MRKYIVGLLLLCGLGLAEELTVGTNTVTVTPSFGTAEHCSVINKSEATVYLQPNSTTIVSSNAIPVYKGFPYVVEAKLIYNISLKTTNSAANVAVAFE